MTGPRKGLRNQPTRIAFGCETVVRQIKYFAWKLSTLCGRPLSVVVQSSDPRSDVVDR